MPKITIPANETAPQTYFGGDGSVWRETKNGWFKLTDEEIDRITFGEDGRPILHAKNNDPG